MALAVSVRFDFVDRKGKTSFTKIRVPNGFSVAQYTEFAQSAAQLISDLVQSKITRASFCVGLDLSSATIKAVPHVLSDIAHKISLGFQTAVAGFRKRMNIPALNEDLVIVGSDAVDQSDPDVAAFITAMETGIVTAGGTISPVNSRDMDIVSTSYARETFRRT